MRHSRVRSHLEQPRCLHVVYGPSHDWGFTSRLWTKFVRVLARPSTHASLGEWQDDKPHGKAVLQYGEALREHGRSALQWVEHAACV